MYDLPVHSMTSLYQEEREVLESIYESDECFKQLSPTSFSYRVNDEYTHTHDSIYMPADGVCIE